MTALIPAMLALILVACQGNGTSTPPAAGAAGDTARGMPGNPVDTVSLSRTTQPDSAAGDPGAPAEGAGTLPPLTPDGWGPLRIGMTLAEVTAAAGPDADPEAVGGPDPERCDEFRPERAPAGMLVMVEHGLLTRISLAREHAVKTMHGFTIGDNAEAIEAELGSAAVSDPHQYKPAPARYITIWRTAPPTAGARGILYDVGTDGRVDIIRAGGRSIQYVEGCV